MNSTVAPQPESHPRESEACRKPSTTNTKGAGTQIPPNSEIKHKTTAQHNRSSQMEQPSVSQTDQAGCGVLQMVLPDHRGSTGLLDGGQRPDLPGAHREDPASLGDGIREEQDGQP